VKLGAFDTNIHSMLYHLYSVAAVVVIIVIAIIGSLKGNLGRESVKLELLAINHLLIRRSPSCSVDRFHIGSCCKARLIRLA
jgi:hypothetical protein